VTYTQKVITNKYSTISEKRLIFRERLGSNAETTPNNRLDLAMSKIEGYAKTDKNLKAIEIQSAVSWINEASEALESRMNKAKYRSEVA